MRTALSITAHDLRRLYTNVMTGIVMVGLVVLPCFFAWFNVLATWNPFGNTQRFQVAVANADEGFSSDMLPLKVNAGDMALSQLARNHDMDWVITDEDQAIEGAKCGEYYAAIVLPKTLSKDMFTFYAGDAHPSEISVYVNEKKSPLSPMLVSSGSEGVNEKINESFTHTLSEVAFGVVDTVHGALNDDDTRAALDSLETRLRSGRDDLNSAAGTADAIAGLADSTVPLVDNANGIAGSMRDSLDSVDAADFENLGGGIAGSAGAIGGALGAAGEGLGPIKDQVDQILANTGESRQAAAASLDDVAGRVQVSADQYREVRGRLTNQLGPALPPQAGPAVDGARADLDDAIARLDGLHDRLTDAAARLRSEPTSTSDEDKQDIQASIARARDAIAGVRTTFETQVVPQVEQISASLDTLKGDVAGARADIDKTMATLGNSPNSLRDTLTNAGGALRGLADELRGTAGKMDEALGAVYDSKETGNLDKLAQVIAGDPEELADTLANPVDIERHAVFERTSFGAGVAPLYTVLALWVGAVLTCVAVRTDKDSVRQSVRASADVTAVQRYFGRYLTFATTGLLQSTLLIGGLIVYVEINPAHPLLLFVAGWVASLVFQLMCFTFVDTFGNAGKALGVLLLVLQVSAAGGAYPLVLLPDWVSSVSPWLPGTYVITALRAALFGTYNGDFTKALAMLGLFVIPTLLIGLVIRPLIAGPIGKVNDAIENTRVMQ